MSELSVENIWFSYGRGNFQLQDVSLHVPAGSRLGVIGPSGSGKSTLVRIIGGHVKIDQGRLVLSGKDISRLPPGQRDVLTVFQNHALFPHLTAYENVEFPLTVHGKLKRTERHALVRKYLERFGLWNRRDNRPSDLSGGEQQRTALARALVLEPSLLLLDEPTASLDTQQKNELALLIEESAHWETRPTIVVITHDHEFAFSLCDRLAVLKDGKAIACGETEQIVSYPPNIDAAKVLDFHSILYGTVDEALTFVTDDGSWSFRLPSTASQFRADRCAVLLRSEAIDLHPAMGSDEVGLRASVRSIQFRGAYTRVLLDHGRQRLICDMPRKLSVSQYMVGQELDVCFSTTSIQVVPRHDLAGITIPNADLQINEPLRR
jgi:putative spermidine/putrescine transport system ATP-binding protein